MESLFNELCKTVIEDAGYNLEKVSWKNNELCFYISKDGNIEHADCKIVTKLIEPIIDANDAKLGENYSLSVSSVGVDGKDWE